ncbi:MAG TPA: YraN family protein [Flavobacteriales bacterium]
MKEGKEKNKEKGDEGEAMAAAFLEQKGYTIRERKWKYERYEIDLIAEKADVIVFVEVKLRYSDTFGEPWEAVNKAKRQKICAGADAYIHQYDIYQEPRFDIISIIKSGREFRLEHIEEAFWPMA